MRCARPRRVRGLAALLAVSVLTASSLASAQEVGPPSPFAGETVGLPGGEEMAPTGGESTVEGPVPPESQPPYRAPSFPKMVLLDTEHVLTSPLRWRGREWVLFSTSTAALATLSLADESLSDAAREHGSALGFLGDRLEGLGDARSVVLLGGFYLAGAIRHDSKAKNVCLDGLVAALIANGMITPALSTFVGRERPTEEQGAYSFRPFNGRAFPSGHATNGFAVASVIATSYDSAWVKVTAYGAAAMAAYLRVQRGKHFPTDVVAGALVGTFVGRSVVHFNRRLRSGEKEPEREGARLTILPMVSGGAYGVSATLEF